MCSFHQVGIVLLTQVGYVSIYEMAYVTVSFHGTAIALRVLFVVVFLWLSRWLEPVTRHEVIYYALTAVDQLRLQVYLQFPDVSKHGTRFDTRPGGDNRHLRAE